LNNNKADKKKKQKRDQVYTPSMARAKYEDIQAEESGSPKKPFEDPVEAKIRKAMAEGEFDNLKGKGKPLDLDKYDRISEHMRIAYHILRNAGYVPEEVRLKKEMELLKEKIAGCGAEKEKQKLMKQLAEVSQQFFFIMEYNKQFMK